MKRSAASIYILFSAFQKPDIPVFSLVLPKAYTAHAVAMISLQMLIGDLFLVILDYSGISLLLTRYRYIVASSYGENAGRAICILTYERRLICPLGRLLPYRSR